MKIKVCHIASYLDYSLLLEATGGYLDKEKYEVSFVFLSPEKPPLHDLLVSRGHEVSWIKYSERKNLVRAIVNLRQIFKSIKPDIVHTHLVDASLAGLTAAKLSGIKRRVHTRHHSTECHTYYKHGVYYDRFINWLSYKIIATTNVVKETLIEMEGVKSDKVSLIPYGYDLSEFRSDEETCNELIAKYELTENYPVVGVISRFVEWKGVQYIIPAFAEVVKKYPNAKLVLANAVGRLENEIKALLAKHLKLSQYVLIEFEPRVFDLYKTFDIFVHVPINRDFEAFGQIYIEALYMEIPSVFTLSGVANDFIRDRENALVVPYCDSDSIFAAIDLLLTDSKLRGRIAKKGKSEVESLFSGEKMASSLEKFYSEL